MQTSPWLHCSRLTVVPVNMRSISAIAQRIYKYTMRLFDMINSTFNVPSGRIQWRGKGNWKGLRYHMKNRNHEMESTWSLPWNMFCTSLAITVSGLLNTSAITSLDRVHRGRTSSNGSGLRYAPSWDSVMKVSMHCP